MTAVGHDEIMQLTHDVRTHLGAVFGYAEMILEEGDGLLPELVNDLNNISSAGHELLRVADTRFGAAATDRAEIARMTRHDLMTQLSIVIDTARLAVRRAPADAAWRKDLEKIEAAAVAVFSVIDRFEQNGLTRAPQGYLEPFTGADAATTLPAHLSHCRVLIVDDTPMSLELMRRQVELLGCKTQVAADAVTALSLLSTKPFDLVLLDLSMPDLDGDEVLQRIKRHPKLRQLPVIMTSASNDFDMVVRCIQRGAEDFLPKPVNPVLLQARLCSALQRKQLVDMESDYRSRLQKEKQRVEELLHAILPARAVQELQQSQRVQPRRHDRVAVLFCDVCNFTAFSEQHQPEKILEYLQDLYEHFETVCDRFGLEKIKTIGDSFMAVAGLEESVRSPVVRAIHGAQEMIRLAPTLAAQWRVRAAINVGPVVSGVVGRAKFAYDVWGDTVNVAARIEAQARPGEIWLSQSVVEELEDNQDAFPCGFIELKGKGSTPLYRMDGAAEKQQVLS